MMIPSHVLSHHYINHISYGSILAYSVVLYTDSSSWCWQHTHPRHHDNWQGYYPMDLWSAMEDTRKEQQFHYYYTYNSIPSNSASMNSLSWTNQNPCIFVISIIAHLVFYILLLWWQKWVRQTQVFPWSEQPDCDICVIACIFLTCTSQLQQWCRLKLALLDVELRPFQWEMYILLMEWWW